MTNSDQISRVFLVAAAIFCLSRVSYHDDPFDIVAYVAAGMTGIFALLHTYNDNDLVRKIKEWTEIIESFSYPLLVAYLCLKYNIYDEYYLGYAIPITMLSLKVVGHDILGLDPDKLLVGSYLVTKIICIYVGIIKENIYALAATVVFFLGESAVIAKDHLSLSPEQTANYTTGLVIMLFSFAFEKE